MIKYFIEVADENIDYSDEWEYKRLVELVMLCVPELKECIQMKLWRIMEESSMKLVPFFKSIIEQDLCAVVICNL